MNNNIFENSLYQSWQSGNENLQSGNVSIEKFWPIYTLLNSEKYKILNKKQADSVYRRVKKTLFRMNKDNPNFRNIYHKISTLPLPFIKDYTDTKKKANNFFRKQLKKLFPNEFILLIGVAELYKCVHKCHYINSDLKSWSHHNISLCYERKTCKEFHSECEQGWHFPFWHKPNLNLTSWPHGKAYEKIVYPDSCKTDEDNYYDIDVELSYFLKNYIVIKLRPNDFKKKKFDINGLYYHRFNEKEDEDKRNLKTIRNHNDYLSSKSTKPKKEPSSDDFVIIENNLGEKIKLKRNSLIQRRVRIKKELKKTRWSQVEEREIIDLKIKALNFIIKSKKSHWILNEKSEWMWKVLEKKKQKNKV